MPEPDLDRYWNNRAMVCPFYSHVPKYRLHFNYMQTWLMEKVAHGPKYLLDFGCGTGDMFACWGAAREVFAYDRSSVMVHHARILCRQKNWNVKFVAPDAINRALVPYSKKMFDCVAMVNVLPALRPAEFAEFANELRRISIPGAQWLIVTADAFDDSAQSYQWNHDYGQLFGKDTKVLDDQIFGPYRYIEVEYVGAENAAKAGGIEPVQVNGIVSRHCDCNPGTPTEVVPEPVPSGSAIFRPGIEVDCAGNKNGLDV